VQLEAKRRTARFQRGAVLAGHHELRDAREVDEPGAPVQLRDAEAP
jgi:hypothetical protein